MGQGEVGHGVVMARPKDPGMTSPTEFPAGPPLQSGPDMTSWLIAATTRNSEATARLDATVSGLAAQLVRIEAKLDTVIAESAKHGNWIYGVTLVAIVIAAIGGWIGKEITDILHEIVKAKLGVK